METELPQIFDLPPGHLANRRDHLIGEIRRIDGVFGGTGGAAGASATRPVLRVKTTVAVALAAVVVMTVAVPLLWSPEGGPRAEAVEALSEVARVAAARPAPPLTDDYRYTKSKFVGVDFYDTPTAGDYHIPVLQPNTREIWIGPDGSGRILETYGEPSFLGPADRARWEAAGRPQLRAQRSLDERFGPGELSHTDLGAFPTSADALFEVVRSQAERTGNPLPPAMLTVVEELLQETVAPPELRAALYEVAARIPGVELVGNVPDPAGRQGVAVAVTSIRSYYDNSDGALVREELIFDPVTSELLATRGVLLERVEWLDAEPPVVLWSHTYLGSGLVDATDERP